MGRVRGNDQCPMINVQRMTKLQSPIAPRLAAALCIEHWDLIGPWSLDIGHFELRAYLPFAKIRVTVFQFRVVTLQPNSFSRMFIKSVVCRFGESVRTLHTSVSEARRILKSFSGDS